jgi:hypothetical protein
MFVPVLSMYVRTYVLVAMNVFCDYIFNIKIVYIHKFKFNSICILLPSFIVLYIIINFHIWWVILYLSKLFDIWTW